LLQKALNELKEKLKGSRFGLIGVGNIFRGDDGAGPRLIEKLTGAVSFPVIDASEVPENYSGWILKSDLKRIVFVDAVEFGGVPGEVRLIPVEQLMISASSTHRMSLHFMVWYLKENWDGEALLLAIQPASLELTDKLSNEVQVAVEELTEFFIDLDTGLSSQ